MYARQLFNEAKFRISDKWLELLDINEIINEIEGFGERLSKSSYIIFWVDNILLLVLYDLFCCEIMGPVVGSGSVVV